MAVMKEDRLLQAVTETTAGRERDWARQVQTALAGVARALQHHTAAAELPDGIFAEVDLTRPTLTRRVAQLCREHGDFLKKLQAL
jgi:hypothetical protein